jgi:hypothetical protein
MYTLTVRRLKEQIKQCQTHFAQEQITHTVNLITKPFLRRQAANTNFLNTSSQSTPMSATELRRKRLQRQDISFDLSEETSNKINLPKDKNSSLERQKSFIHTEYACPKNPFCQLKCTCNHQQSGENNPNCLQCYETTNLPHSISLSVPVISHQSSSTIIKPVKRQRLTLIPSLASTRATSSAVRNEQKAVKVLGVVFAIFVVAWFPFCIMNILRGICKRCLFNEHLLNGFAWLGYVSASINPVVYTIFNRNFRLKFITLLKCQCLYSKNRQKQLSYYQSHSSLHGSRIYRTNGLVQNDIRRFNTQRQMNETILT